MTISAFIFIQLKLILIHYVVELRFLVYEKFCVSKNRPLGSDFFIVAPPVRLELTTSKLTASCSTIELQGNL